MTSFGFDNAEYIKRMQPIMELMQRIADMPTTPRPDGTYNVCREAIIDMAAHAMKKFWYESDNDVRVQRNSD